MIRVNLIRGQVTCYRTLGSGVCVCATLPSPIASVDAEALVRELLLLMFRGQRQSEAVLAYLAAAEAREPDVWLRDDIRISWLTVLHAAQGTAQPWEYAFWRYLGRHSSKLIPEFVARADKHAAMEPGASALGAHAPALPPTLNVETTFHTNRKGMAESREGLLPKRRVHMGLTGHEAGHVEVDTCDRGKPEHGDQARDTTDSHIGVCPDAAPAGLPAPAENFPNLTPHQETPLPPKKPVQSVPFPAHAQSHRRKR